MSTLLQVRPVKPVDVHNSRVLCITAVPGTSSIVSATENAQLICGEETRVTTDAFARGIASLRYASLAADSLPEEKAVVLVLINAIGLRIYSFPSLHPFQGSLAQQLESISKTAHVFSVDSLGSDLVGESFRVAIGQEDTVFLLDINPTHDKVTVLGKHTLGERVVAVAFSEMTIVASTIRIHHLLRISRGGGLAVAATVNRSQRPRRPSASVAVGDGSAAVVSFFGGLFGRRDISGIVVPPVAFALPENRWLLIVDQELVTYSSFGAKLDEMENVFRSKSGMDISDTGSGGRTVSVESKNRHRKSTPPNSNSVSSFGSIGTGVSQMTFLDEGLAKRAERPAHSTVFSSPFVLSVSGKNEVMAFASNGSVQGVMQQLVLTEEEVGKEGRVRIVTSRYDRVLATAYWPSGRVVVIELVNDLESLIEQMEGQEELRLALALVPTDQVDRMISLRRLLAFESRKEEWHDAAIHHMQNIVNLSVKREGVDQLDLVSEAIELRGPIGSGWQSDAVTATMWADFLFRLRRRVMRPCSADIGVLETLCQSDESSSRIKSLLSVKHDVPLSTGEALITSPDSALREEERVEALVALYTSLAEHGKALLLLENSEVSNSFDGVVGYLSGSMRACDDPDAFFLHLKWLAQQSVNEAQGYQKLEYVVLGLVRDAKDSELIMGLTFEVLVEEAEALIDVVVDDICNTRLSKDSADRAGKQLNGSDETSNTFSADVLASALLAGMVKANSLEKVFVFNALRTLFGSRVLHNEEASYHSYTLLQSLQTAENKALRLHEELAFLLGRQGRHEAAADELAAEMSLGPEEALSRLTRMLPASDKATAGESLMTAYLRVSAQGRAMRIKEASMLLKRGAGNMEIEKLLLDARCSDDSLTLSQMQPLLETALASGSERFRLAEMIRALRKSEVRRLREEVLSRRRRFVVIGHDRACTLCTRRIGNSVFAAYSDGSVAHLACDISKGSRAESPV